MNSRTATYRLELLFHFLFIDWIHHQGPTGFRDLIEDDGLLSALYTLPNLFDEMPSIRDML
ncbi:MAG: hypothetical protein WBM40_07415 [Thiohalocapsa sp.]